MCAKHALKITSPANETSHTANNPRKYAVRQYNIDDVLKHNDSKCDYLVINDDRKRAYFIELKTESDLEGAPGQIETTRRLLKDEASIPQYSHRLRILAKLDRIPKIKPSFFRNWEDDHDNAFYAMTGTHTENV